MANLSEDIQNAGSDTRPPMLDRFDFESWQQHIRLYCMGKDNGENIIKSIDEGPFKMGKFIETLAEGAEDALHLGPERDSVIAYLTLEEKERYKADTHATNILLQGLPKDIYTLSNHYTDAKDIWDNVKMLLEGSELTKDDRKSQLYDDFEHFHNTQLDSGLTPTDNLIENLTKIVALLAQSYKTYLPQTNNQLRTSSNTRNQATVQNGRVVVQNVQGRQNKGQRNNTRGAVVTGNGGVQNRVAQENGVVLDEEQLLFIAGGQDNAFDDNMDKPQVQDHDNYQDTVGEYHEVQEMQNDVQPNYVVDYNVEYTKYTLEIAEKSKIRMLKKMKSTLWVDSKINITSPDYSKENYLATFTPQRHLNPKQIFWSSNIEKMTPKPISNMTVYPPNTPARLVSRVLSTKSQVKINI
nr:integrase, catalytic region, zinc finger, CCHC-type, peptidase aspartic, catalytic [Tanacetum cinerariifolium]